MKKFEIGKEYFTRSTVSYTHLAILPRSQPAGCRLPPPWSHSGTALRISWPTVVTA